MFFWLGFLPPMIINEVEHDLPPLAIMLFRPFKLVLILNKYIV